MGSQVSINDVAAAAGVSRATTARALAGIRNVNPSIVEAVRKAAAELGYQRNALAGSLRSQTTHTVGMVVPQIANPFFPMMIAATERQLQMRGVIMLLCDSQDDPELEAHRTNALLELRVDGLIISPCHADRSRDTLLRARERLPVVQLDRFVEGMVTDWVGSDDAFGIAQVIEHLAGAGAKSFAFVSSLPDSSSARLRTQAYRNETAPWGPASADRILAGDFSSAWGQQAARQLLAEGPLPDAVVCGSDTIAFGLLHEFHAHGVHVPDDVMVTGHDDVGQSFLTIPSLTTVRQPYTEVAAMAVDLLDRRSRADAVDEPFKHVNIHPALVPRQSTRHL